MPSTSADSFFVYILLCSDGSFYTGHTSDLDQRVKAHNDARAATWTARRRPVHLVYDEPCATEAQAITRELQLKRWTHAKKLAMLNGERAKLKSLAKRRER